MNSFSNKQEINLSIVIPCLNEEETIGICIKKCFDIFSKLGITGEVIVVDNNSTDSSAKLALESGAKVCSNNIKGYGISLIKGFECASGEYILFADGDDSYDFLEVEKFWKNRNMGDMILGSRFKGTICKGAMPALHRYFGTPFLTLCLNILYGCKISDSQSGMRMCKKKDIDNINLESTGMEFASEILIKYAINKLTIYEIPVTLHKDGRTNHKPHLRPFRDGFRHLFYMIKKRF